MGAGVQHHEPLHLDIEHIERQHRRRRSLFPGSPHTKFQLNFSAYSRDFNLHLEHYDAHLANDLEIIIHHADGKIGSYDMAHFGAIYVGHDLSTFPPPQK